MRQSRRFARSPINSKTVVTAAGTNADAYVKAMTTRRNILVNFAAREITASDE